MEPTEELKQAVNDVLEDHREEGESIEDVASGDRSAVNDVAEDHREEGESLEDLKRMLQQALYENATLKNKMSDYDRQLDEFQRSVLGVPRGEAEKDKTYSSLKGEYK